MLFHIDRKYLITTRIPPTSGGLMLGLRKYLSIPACLFLLPGLRRCEKGYIVSDLRPFSRLESEMKSDALWDIFFPVALRFVYVFHLFPLCSFEAV